MYSNPKFASPGHMWTVHDVAAFLQMSISWVYKQVEAGLLPVRRIGANLRFLPEEIHAYAAGNWRPQPAARALARRS